MEPLSSAPGEEKKRICKTNHRWVHPLKLHLMSSRASCDISSSYLHHQPPHLLILIPCPRFPLSPLSVQNSVPGRRGHQSPSARGCRGRVPGLRQIISCPHSHRTPHDVWEGRRWSNLGDQTRHREGGGFKTCWSLSGKVDVEADRLRDGLTYSVDILFSCASRPTKMKRVEGARRRMNTLALLEQPDSCPPTRK